MNRLNGQKYIGIVFAAVLALVLVLEIGFVPSAKHGEAFDASALHISEVAPCNTCIVADANGEFSDYIELYNSTDQLMDLSGLGLGDGEDSPRFVFPAGTMLEGKSAMVLFCNALPFSVNDGEAVVLFDRAGAPVFTVNIPRMEKNHVLYLSGGEYVTTDAPSPGFANDEAGEAAFQSSKQSDLPLCVNELCAGAFTDQKGDWVEFCNTADTAQDFSGLYLSDESTDLLKCPIPAFSLEAGEVVLLHLSDLPGSFALKSGETLYLCDARANVIDAVEILEADADRSQDAADVLDFATPGYPNDEEGLLAYLAAQDHSLVITEVMSDNAMYLRGPYGTTHDYIELCNVNDETLDLSEFSISDSTDGERFALGDGELLAGECIVFLAEKDGTRFLQGYPTLDFGVSSRGETLVLYHQDRPIYLLHVPRLTRNQAYGLDETLRPCILEETSIGVFERGNS